MIITLGDGPPKYIIDSNRAEVLWSSDLLLPENEDISVKVQKGDTISIVELVIEKGEDVLV